MNYYIIYWTNLMAYNFVAELWMGVGKDVTNAKENGGSSGGPMDFITSLFLGSSAGGAGGKTWGQLDKNGDGVIDRNEAKAAGLTDSQFNALDKNHDGMVDRGEFDAADK